MTDWPVYRTIRVAHDDDVVHLTFARPDRRNALTHEMMGEISDVLRRVLLVDGVRALVLRGSGGFFCAGGDIGAMVDLPPPPPAGERDPLLTPYRAFGDTLLELNRLPLPVVSVVEGAAAGGGFGMACASDVVIMHASARFGIPEPRAGFIPSQVLPPIVRRIGEGAARELAVTGRMIDAREALRIGVGLHLCEDHAAMDATLARILDDIRRSEPDAVRTVKSVVLACATEEDGAVLDRAAGELIRLLRSPSGTAGMQAFLTKTPPPWSPLARKPPVAE